MLRKMLAIMMLIVVISSLPLTVVLTVSTSIKEEGFRRTVSILVPAVSQTEKGLVGVISNLTVTVKYPGSGNIYVSTMPLTQIDMQASARTAAIVASTLLGYNPLNVDFYVSMESPAITIGGPSAGAAMTIAMIAALGGLQINHSVMLTGMINPDGTIGPVGGIKEKLEASAKVGAKVFLVPIGQTVVYERKIEYKKIGPFILQTVKKVPVNIYEYGKELGVKVVEVSNIAEVVKHVLNVSIPYINFTTTEPTYSSEVKHALNEQINYFKRCFNEIKESIKVSPKVEGIVNEAEDLMNKALTLQRRGLLYSAASSAFQAAYTIDYAKVLLNFESKGEKVLEELYNEVNASIVEVETILNKTKPSKLSDVGVLIASHYRLLLAQKFLRKAGDLYSQGEIEKALLNLVYAKWRAITAKLWLNSLGLGLISLPSESTILRYSQTIVYEAYSVVAYATSLLEDLGVASDPIVNAALEDLEDSRNAMEKGDIYGGLGLALSSIAEATTAIHKYFTVNVNKQREAVKAIAKGYIAKARELGVEPILSLGYYEYAKQQESILDELYFYELASMHSKVLIDIYLISSIGNITITTTSKTLVKEKPTITPQTTNTTTPSETITITEKETIEFMSVLEKIFPLTLAFLGGLLVGYALRKRSSATPG